MPDSPPDPLAETLPPVRIPARFVPISALATGLPGAPAAAVSPANPLPTADAAYRSARPLAADTTVAPGRALMLDCSAAGMLSFELADGSALAFELEAGLTILPFAVRAIAAAATTATITAWVLD